MYIPRLWYSSARLRAHVWPDFDSQHVYGRFTSVTSGCRRRHKPLLTRQTFTPSAAASAKTAVRRASMLHALASASVSTPSRLLLRQRPIASNPASARASASIVPYIFSFPSSRSFFRSPMKYWQWWRGSLFENAAVLPRRGGGQT